MGHRADYSSLASLSSFKQGTVLIPTTGGCHPGQHTHLPRVPRACGLHGLGQQASWILCPHFHPSSNKSHYRLGKDENSLCPTLATWLALPALPDHQETWCSQQEEQTWRSHTSMGPWGWAAPSGGRVEADGGKGTLEASEINCTSLKTLPKAVPSLPRGHLFAFVVKNASI